MNLSESNNRDHERIAHLTLTSISDADIARRARVLTDLLSRHDLAEALLGSWRDAFPIADVSERDRRMQTYSDLFGHDALTMKVWRIRAALAYDTALEELTSMVAFLEASVAGRVA